jgi:endonuclease/exonuclease/phosphatase family metal-dependent hydrolase
MRTLFLLVTVGLGACTGSSPAPPVALDVVTLNLWHDRDDWPARLDVIADTLGALRPDVIVLQEVLQDSEKGLANQAETLGARLGYAVVFAAVDGPERPKRYGNAILSRHPVRDTGWVKLRPLTDYRVAARARLDVGGRPLDVVATHLHHTVEGDSIRAVQVADLLAFLDRTADAPVIVAGDFNAPADAPSLAPLAARAVSAFDAVRPDAEVSTLVEALGHTPRRIDHVFAGPGLRPVDARIVLGAPVGGVQPSDHRGVWARFVWVPE